MSEEDRSRRMEGLKAKYQDLLKRAQPVADKGARLNDRIEGVLKRRKSGEEDEEEGKE